MEIGNIHPVSTRKNARGDFSSAREPAAFTLGEKVQVSLLSRSAPRPQPLIVSPDRDTVAAAYREQNGRGVSHVAVVRRGSERLIKPLGDQKVLNSGEFTFGQQSYVLNLVDDAGSAEAAFNAGDDLSPYAASPVAMVYDSNGRMHLVCLTTDARLQSGKGPKASKPIHVIALLKRMHNRGITSGGMPPDAVVSEGGRAKVKNPARLQAMNDNDSLLYELVATLAMQNRHGEVGGRKNMARLAKAYLSSCVVGRHYVTEELRRRGSNAPPSEAVADLAMKFSGML